MLRNPTHLDWQSQVRYFWAQFMRDEITGCLIWQRSCSRYGAIRWKGKPTRAHRVAWELSYGEIPPGMMVLHQCDTPACGNPFHLFLGTQADNMADMKTKGRHRSPRRELKACKRGHAFTEANTHYARGRRPGWVCRTCRACRAARERERRANQRRMRGST